jgi:hypothetical protein
MSAIITQHAVSVPYMIATAGRGRTVSVTGRACAPALDVRGASDLLSSDDARMSFVLDPRALPIGATTTVLLVLLAAVGLLVLVAWANVANLRVCGVAAALITPVACRGTSERQPASGPISPPGLHTEAVALDSVRRRVVMFGGVLEDSLTPGGYRSTNDTYEWDGARWLRPSASNAPRNRAGAAMAYDPLRNATVMVGGLTAANAGDSAAFVVTPCPSCQPTRQLSDAWQYDGALWTRAPDGPLAHDADLVFDTRRGRMMLFGYRGLFGSDDPLPTTLWEFGGDRWQLVDTTGPRAASSVRADYDSKRGVVVWPILDGPDRAVWEWNGGWVRVQPAQGPGVRRDFVTTFDHATGLLLLFGGQTHEPPRQFNDLWGWDGRAWTLVHDGSGTAPSARADGSLLFDAATGQVLLIGGLGPNQRLLRETWSFVSGNWRRVE